MKFQIREKIGNRILKATLIVSIILIISLNIYGISITKNPIVFDNLGLSQDEDDVNNFGNDNPDFINLQYIHFQYTSGITSNDSNDIFVNCTLFIGLPIAIEFSIILKKKNVSRINKSDVDSSFFDLDNSEKLILDLVQEYLSKNRTCNKNALINYITARFGTSNINFSKNGISAILYSLFDKNIIVDGSKLVRSDILLNPNRKKIHDHVLNNPGVHFMEIVRNVQLTNYLVKWHLDMLMRFNYIKKEKIENFNAYYSYDFESEDNYRTHFLSRPNSKQILNYLIVNEGVTKYQLSIELGMHQATIYKYILKFEEFGILCRRKYSNKVLYFINANFFESEQI